jgi:protein-disulfide isomerase
MTGRVAPVAMAAAILLGVSSARAQEHAAPSRGPATAPAQVEVFLSFDAEPSARAAVVLDTLQDRRPGGVRIVFRHLTREGDHIAIEAHRAALAAAAQGQFWEMAGLLFANQGRREREAFVGMAQQLGLDPARFAADLDGAAADAILAADREHAARLGVTQAPTFVINGTRVAGIRTVKEIEALLTR